MDLNLNGGVCQLHKAAADEQGRYALQQIDLRQVQTDEGPKMRCAATDGRGLAVVDLAYDFGDDVAGRVSQEAWSTAAKLKANKKGCNGPLLKANGKVQIVGKDGEAIEFERPPHEPDGSDFPAYEKVIPEIKPGAFVVGFNPLLLLSLCEAIGMTKDKAYIRMTVNDPDEETPQLVRMAQRAAEELEKELAWQRPEPDMLALTRLEGQSDEEWAESLVQHDQAERTRIDELAREQLNVIADWTKRLIRAVNALREFPQRPRVAGPILLTRGSDVPNAKAVLMPIVVE